MADYYTPTVIQQTIPEADMTPLERLLLSHIFEAERDGEGWYFFSDSAPADMIAIECAALSTALAASELGVDTTANAFVERCLASASAGQPHDAHLDLDFCDESWQSILQDIVRRSSTLQYVSVVSSFTCSRMRPDGFGGAALVISADAIIGKSTNDLLEEFIAQVAPSAR